MKEYRYIDIKDIPSIIDEASKWFSSKWSVPIKAYKDCMEAYINGDTKYGWFLCLDEDKIIGGLGVIDNDFHCRKDLSPNVCAVYVEEEYRNQKVAGNLLEIVLKDCKQKGISPIYLVSDHIGFYERYGWEFVCMVLCDDNSMSRMYIHR